MSGIGGLILVIALLAIGALIGTLVQWKWQWPWKK